MRVLHWFRSDLRLRDNLALAGAARRAERLLPVFVFDPALLAGARTGAPRVHFMVDCLERLAADLSERGSKLIVRNGRPERVLCDLVRETGAELVTFARDYSPYALRRDERVRRAIEKLGARVETFKDRVVFEADEILTRSDEPYSVYSPYRRSWRARLAGEPLEEARPLRLPPPLASLRAGEIPAADSLCDEPLEAELPTGGADAARRRLATFLDKQAAGYAEQRDLPAVDGTSRLSPYLRFGAISVRECVRQAQERVHHTRGDAAKAIQVWIDQLVWRDFYHAVLRHHPHVLDRSYRSEYDAMEWEEDEEGFQAWCRGETGYPIVDAGMRQLARTGWMHNRLRMIVASFLTKDLLVDWRRGERFFQRSLVDGDPANNNGGWQWAASTGTDPQPYFRIFNPTTQSKRFDPDGTFIRRYVPELEAADARAVHDPSEHGGVAGYPEPRVSHAERRVLAKRRYEAARKQGRGG